MDPLWAAVSSEYFTPPLFSSCPSICAALLRRRNHPSPANSAKATTPPTTPPAIAPAFDFLDVSVFVADEAAAVVVAAAGCEDDEDVAAAFVGFAVCELDCDLDCELDCELDWEFDCVLDGAAVGFVFTA